MRPNSKLPRQCMLLGTVYFVLAMAATSASQAVAKAMGAIGIPILAIVLIRYLGQSLITGCMLLRRGHRARQAVPKPIRSDVLILDIRRQQRRPGILDPFKSKAPKVQLRRGIVAIFGTVAVVAKSQYLDIGVSTAVTLAFSPVFLLAFAPFFETKKITVWTILAVIVGLAGVYVMAPTGISREALVALTRSMMSQGVGALDKAGNIAAVMFIIGMFWCACNSGADAVNQFQNRAAAESGDSKELSLFYQSLVGTPLLLALLMYGAFHYMHLCGSQGLDQFAVYLDPAVLLGRKCVHAAGMFTWKVAGLSIGLIALGLAFFALLLLAGERTDVSRLAPFRCVQVFFGCGLDVVFGSIISADKMLAMGIMIVSMLIGLKPEMHRLFRKCRGCSK